MLGLIDGDVFLHWAAHGSDTPDDAVQMLNDILEEAKETSWAEEFKIAIKGKNNFRKNVTDTYKAKRKPPDEDTKEKLVACAKAIVKDHEAVMAHGMEADDYIRIWSEEARAAGIEFIVIAEDKDLLCIGGRFFNPKKREMRFIDENEADLLYHSQLLTGDSADDIKGLFRVGPKTAEKWLKDVPMGERMDVVIKKWQEYHPEDWYDKLMTCGKLIHILKSHDDSFYVPRGTEENESEDTGESETLEA